MIDFEKQLIIDLAKYSDKIAIGNNFFSKNGINWVNENHANGKVDANGDAMVCNYEMRVVMFLM